MKIENHPKRIIAKTCKNCNENENNCEDYRILDDLVQQINRIEIIISSQSPTNEVVTNIEGFIPLITPLVENAYELNSVFKNLQSLFSRYSNNDNDGGGGGRKQLNLDSIFIFYQIQPYFYTGRSETFRIFRNTLQQIEINVSNQWDIINEMSNSINSNLNFSTLRRQLLTRSIELLGRILQSLGNIVGIISNFLTIRTMSTVTTTTTATTTTTTTTTPTPIPPNQSSFQSLLDLIYNNNNNNNPTTPGSQYSIQNNTFYNNNNNNNNNNKK
ncbi:hypothetical protein ACTFIR_011944 [Dictyostelium discoideum]